MIDRSKLRLLADKIVSEYKPERIILYGSQCRGEATSESDIDLFIIKDTREEWVQRFVRVKEIVYDPRDYLPVQPVVYTPREVKERLESGDDFVNQILTEGEVLYDKGG